MSRNTGTSVPLFNHENKRYEKNNQHVDDYTDVGPGTAVSYSPESASSQRR